MDTRIRETLNASVPRFDYKLQSRNFGEWQTLPRNDTGLTGRSDELLEITLLNKDAYPSDLFSLVSGCRRISSRENFRFTCLIIRYGSYV